MPTKLQWWRDRLVSNALPIALVFLTSMFVTFTALWFSVAKSVNGSLDLGITNLAPTF
jgi:hypothetical protein